MVAIVSNGTASTVLLVDTGDEVQGEEVGLLEKVGAVLYGKYILANGAESKYYFDSKKLTMHPEGAQFVASQLVRKMDEIGLDVVGGTAYSAIPIVSHICLYSQTSGGKPIRAFYHRKETKGHGTDEMTEGQVPDPGTKVAIVEDVVTSGGSLLKAIGQAKELGLEVTDAIVLVDRDEGGREEVEKAGYKFWALFTVREESNGKVSFRFNGYEPGKMERI